jgi:hypothetical protein
MNLLSVSADAKTIKGEKKGYLTGILYLLPADSSGITNVCAYATEGCKASCLNTAGRGAFSSVQQGRMRKTKMFIEDREGFLDQLEADIRALVKKAKRDGLKPCVRVNGTSDLPWMARQLAQKFPKVSFYDYSKIPQPWKRVLPNYHLTFSYSESNADDCQQALSYGINVAMVFDTERGQPLPKTWMGFKVIDGDLSDLRFKDPKGVIVGLRAKGRAKKDCTGFVVRLNPTDKQTLVQIAGSR